ncbi:MAG TPA: PLP-dependent aminotransferase family protein, partial [Candidatus Limnocylindrales bacterium]|nr:PLP-dependent aminotransferase family protein [Candidatus Limnocylindrales bacterium]
QECYGQLQAEGYLETRIGSATTVAPCAVARTEKPPAPQPKPAPKWDFRPGVPDLASFPRGDWLWAQRETARTAPTAALDYGDPCGNPVFREVLAAYLGRVRGAAAQPHRLVVCNGFAQGLNVVLRVLARSGVSTVAFEDPGYDDTSAVAAQWAGVRTVPVPVDEKGIKVNALAKSGAQAVVLTPAHQWPTGVVLAPSRRRELVAWAEANDVYLIEDDYDAEFRYDREPVGCLQGLGPDRVFLLGTVSKSLAPALRLGWILCPATVLKEMAAEKSRDDRGSPGLDQLALARLIEAGRFDRHLRRMRAVYSARREALVESLHGVPVTGLAAGFHAVAHLPAGASERAVIEAGARRSVGFTGMSRYRSSNAAKPPQLVLGFGNLPERALREGLARVTDLLR